MLLLDCLIVSTSNKTTDFQNIFLRKMFQQVSALLLVFLSHHGEVGGSLQGPSDFPDPFLPGPFHVDHQHIARFDNVKYVIIVTLDSIGKLIIVIIIIIISDIMIITL